MKIKRKTRISRGLKEEDQNQEFLNHHYYQYKSYLVHQSDQADEYFVVLQSHGMKLPSQGSRLN